jgi:hypothetical protein
VSIPDAASWHTLYYPVMSSKLSVEIDPESRTFRTWLQESGDRSVEEFQRGVVERVAAFCAENASVLRCLMCMPGESVRMIFATDPPYDFDLSERIAELDIDITQAGWHYTDTLQFPCGDDIEEMRKFAAAVEEMNADDGAAAAFGVPLRIRLRTWFPHVYEEPEGED